MYRAAPTPENHALTDADTANPLPEPPLPTLAARGAFGGLLMGLANLVPGISGGTMLLAAGVYRGFVEGIANLTLLRFKLRDVVLLAGIVGAAAVSILLFAGPIKELVVHQRWIMFSLFIGLTLGGVPLIRKMAHPTDGRFWGGCVAGVALMVAIALAGGGDASGGWMMALVAGIAGASAMILPGISGGYLLLLMGMYIPILDAIHTFKEGLKGMDTELILEGMKVGVPVGVGVVIGIVGLSNLLKVLLDKQAQPTLGFLLGLVLGSVLGLWPFREGVEPDIGSVVKGAVVTAETLPTIDPEDWPMVAFTPSAGQVVAALALVAVGYGLTWLIARIGAGSETNAQPS